MGVGGEEWGVTGNGYTVSFWGGKIFYKIIVMIAELWKYTKIH